MLYRAGWERGGSFGIIGVCWQLEPLWHIESCVEEELVLRRLDSCRYGLVVTFGAQDLERHGREWRFGTLPGHDQEEQVGALSDDEAVRHNVVENVLPDVEVQHLPCFWIPRAVLSKHDDVVQGVVPKTMCDEALETIPEVVGWVKLVPFFEVLIRDKVNQLLAPLLVGVPSDDVDPERGQLVVVPRRAAHFGLIGNKLVWFSDVW
jgi:hypothetical protein